MAVTAATATGDFAGFLNPTQAAPLFDQAKQASVVQQLARQVPLGINGVSVPVVTSKPTAGWVAEAGQKPATKGALALKEMQPKKIAAIAVVSAEVVRANPGNYVTIFRADIAEAFAIAFDAAALHGTSTPFAAYIDQTNKSVELGAASIGEGGIHADFVAGLTALVNDGKKLTGFALDDKVEPLIWGAVDTSGRPLYVDLPQDSSSAAVARPGRLLNRPSFMSDGVEGGDTSGVDYAQAYGGDWSQAIWGSVGGITYDVSTEATVTINGSLVSLWEYNLVAIRAEAEYGLLINDVDAFVAYTQASSS